MCTGQPGIQAGLLSIKEIVSRVLLGLLQCAGDYQVFRPVAAPDPHNFGKPDPYQSFISFFLLFSQEDGKKSFKAQLFFSSPYQTHDGESR